MKPKKWLVKYWLEHYVNNNLCSLCGNSGIIDTSGQKSASGVMCGQVNYCICPNGQVMRPGGL